MAEIERLRRLDGFRYQDVAVLAREHKILQPVRAWCRQNGIPHFLPRDDGGIPLRCSREFVRLLDDLEKAGETVAPERFVEIIRSRSEAASWQKLFAAMAEDFEHEYPASGSLKDDRPGFAQAFLRNWLYEYVGNDSDGHNEGLFVGTAHAAKGLEFKHVFALDGGWRSEEESEQRLYYVAMTRAIETLTLLQGTPRHLWIEKLADSEVETVAQSFSPLPELDIEYRVLSVFGGKPDKGGELDIGFTVRDETEAGRGKPQLANIKEVLRQVSSLKTGDELDIRLRGKNYQFCSGNFAVAQLARNIRITELADPALNGRIRAFVEGFCVYYPPEDEARDARIPKELDKWVVVIPRLEIPPKTP